MGDSRKNSKIKEAAHQVIRRLILKQDVIELEIDKRSLFQLLSCTKNANPEEPEVESEPVIHLLEPVSFRRFCGELRLHLPPDQASDRVHSNRALTRAVARAYCWIGQIMNGELANIQEIAQETGLDMRYVSKLLPLAFLAPDITEAIVEGRQAPHWTIEACLESSMPGWSEQRDTLAGS